MILKEHFPVACKWLAEYEDSPGCYLSITYGISEECEVLDAIENANQQLKAAKKLQDEMLGDVFGA